MIASLIVGAIVGTFLWLSKFVLVKLLSPRWFSHWLHSSPKALGLMDLGFSYLSGHTMASVGAQGITALIVMVSVLTCTMTYILLTITKNKAKNLWNSL